MVKYALMIKGKIDVVTKYFYPVAGGIEVNTHRVYKTLAKSGWKVTVHTSRNNLTKFGVLPKKEFVDGMEVRRYDCVSDIVGYTPIIDWNNTNIVALHNFNIFNFRILIKVLWLKLSNRKKFSLILTPHGGFNPEWSTFPIVNRAVKYLLQQFLGRLLINSTVDWIRAVSFWEAQEMIKKGVDSKKIKVILNGLEDEAYLDNEKLASKNIKQKASEYGTYILQIGRIHPIKNFETVIRTLPLINNSVKFVIVGEVGDETYLQEIKTLAKKLDVYNRVIFGGVVRGVDKYYLIRKSKMMVHMAIWESFCNVINEALSQGTICIAANNTALKFLLNKSNGFLVPTKNIKKLAETINFVLKNEKSHKLKIMRRTAMKNARLLNWSGVGLQIEKEMLTYTNEK